MSQDQADKKARVKSAPACISKNVKEAEFHSITAPRVHAAAAQRPTKKDEDVTHIALRKPNATGVIPPAAFAIFDGHGGKKTHTKGDLHCSCLALQAAAMCVEGICGRLLKEVGPITNMMIEDAFWELDADLGESGILSGTTASVLFVEHTGSRLECALAWVGDSTAVHVDMLASADDCKVFVTDDHNPKNEAEVDRMEVEWALRKELHKDWDWVSRENGSVHGGSVGGKSRKHSHVSDHAPSEGTQQSDSEKAALPTASDTADTNDLENPGKGGTEAPESPLKGEGPDALSAGAQKLRQNLLQAKKVYMQVADALRVITGVDPTSKSFGAAAPRPNLAHCPQDAASALHLMHHSHCTQGCSEVPASLLPIRSSLTFDYSARSPLSLTMSHSLLAC
eukprot:2701141-Pleurochrysis_carterae.AAC.3